VRRSWSAEHNLVAQPPGREFERCLAPPELAGEDACATTVDISLHDGQGIESLKDAIKALVWSGEIKSEMLQ